MTLPKRLASPPKPKTGWRQHGRRLSVISNRHVEPSRHIYSGGSLKPATTVLNGTYQETHRLVDEQTVSSQSPVAPGQTALDPPETLFH